MAIFTSSAWWRRDDFFHQGAFRQSQGVAYAAYVEGTNGLSIPDYDQYDFYRKHPTLDVWHTARHPSHLSIAVMP